MEFIYEKFIEEWASIYPPVMHDRKKNQRFLITDSYFNLIEMIKNARPDKSPILVLEGGMEGELGSFNEFSFAVYFLVRADKMRDGYAAVEAYREALNHLAVFVNTLRAFKDGRFASGIDCIPMPEGSYMAEVAEAVKKGKRPLEGLDLDNVYYQPVGPKLDGWVGETASFTCKNPYERCIDGSTFVSD